MKIFKKFWSTMFLVGMSALVINTKAYSYDPCVVQNAENIVDVSYSLASFLVGFNQNQMLPSGGHICQGGIDFMKGINAIDLYETLQLTGGVFVETGGTFNFGPSGLPDRSAKVAINIPTNITFQEFTAGTESMGRCAVFIKSPQVTIRNIVLMGNNTDANGICIDSKSIKFENVVVKYFKGDGIKISAGSTDLRFQGQLNQVAFTKTGISASGEWVESRSINFPFGQATGGSILDLVQNAEYNLYLPTPAFVIPELLTMDEQKDANGLGTGVWNIRGQVYDCEVQTSGGKVTVNANGEILCKDGAKAALPAQVKTIYLYKQEEGNENDITLNLGIKPISTFVQTIEVGTSGIIGYFEFIYDKNAHGTSKIFMIPLRENGLFGSATRVFGIEYREGAFSGGNLGGGSTVGGGGSTGGTGNNGYVGSFGANLFTCGMKVNANPFTDTDMDGITDQVEKNTLRPGVPAKQKGTCDCNQTVTCWHDFDTDGDGISDSAEWGVDPAVPMDTDKDNIPDALDTDSDNDNLADYQEDRTRLFNNSWPAFYRYKGMYYGAFDGAPFVGQDSKPVPCNLSEKNTVGIGYGWYKVDETTLQPSSLNLSDTTYKGRIEHLVCVSSSLDMKKDFNGVYDTNRGETNARNPDTDGDLVCDGNGTACPQPDHLMDRCPEKNLPNVSDCSPECIDSESIMSVNPNYLKKDQNGAPIAELLDLVDKDGNPKDNGDGIADIYQVKDRTTIFSLCSNKDTDHDQIPDCLERDTKTCTPTGQTSLQLDPYNADTDGDGVSDYNDPNPFDKNISDIHDPNLFDKNNKGGDLRHIFGDKLGLYHYVDRDADGRRDDEEDLNVDGALSTVIFDTKETYMKNETDPLDPDTDKDDLDDYTEMNRSGTNPRNADSDHDGSSDKVEIGNGADPLKYDDLGLSGAGCMPPLMDGTLQDTDPWKADTDNDQLRDGYEIKIKTNPNNPDSDGDGILDGVETNKMGDGAWVRYTSIGVQAPLSIVFTELGFNIQSYNYAETNPCSTDTDLDGVRDMEEIQGGQSAVLSGTGCMIKDANSEFGLDSDCDGLPDNVEDKNRNGKYEPELGETDPKNQDSDDDGLFDGCDPSGKGERCPTVRDKQWLREVRLYEGDESLGAPCTATEIAGYIKNSQTGFTIYYNPDILTGKSTGKSDFANVQIAKGCGADSDGDGMADKIEYEYGTFPGNPDTDGDGIVDGIEARWVIAQVYSAKDKLFTLRPNKGDIMPPMEVAGGVSFNPKGGSNALMMDTDGDLLNDRDEDLNADGAVEAWETDPNNPDTDGDGANDHDEVCQGGACNIANIPYARTATRSGCASISGANGGETWGMTIMFVVMLIGTRLSVVYMRRQKKVKAN